jgi:hypothetical protein
MVYRKIAIRNRANCRDFGRKTYGDSRRDFACLYLCGLGSRREYARIVASLDIVSDFIRLWIPSK